VTCGELQLPFPTLEQCGARLLQGIFGVVCESGLADNASNSSVSQYLAK